MTKSRLIAQEHSNTTKSPKTLYQCATIPARRRASRIQWRYGAPRVRGNSHCQTSRRVGAFKGE
jgi:hypothetical protein